MSHNAKRPRLLAEASKTTANSYGRNHGSPSIVGKPAVPHCYDDIDDPGRRLSAVKTDRADGTSRHDLKPDIPAIQINRFRSEPLSDLNGMWNDAEAESY